MDLKLKQRLTGAVILTSLAIILLPLLLDGTEEEQEKVISNIPEPPHIEVGSTTVRDIRARMEAMERTSEAQLPREVVDETDYSQSPDFALDKNRLPVNWSLQVGTFENKDNAIRLRAGLREESYHAYILHSKTNGAETYRVLVGPSSSRKSLLKMNEEIESKLKLKGRIVRYRVEEDEQQLSG